MAKFKLTLKNPNLLKQVVFILCLISFNAPAQTNGVIPDNLDLPSNHIYDITQDEKGHIWITTNRGIIKFDGYTSRSFTTADGLPFNDIYSLKPDPINPNKIWYFASGKYCGYIRNDSVFTVEGSNSDIIIPSFVHIDNEGFWMESSNHLYRLTDDSFNIVIPSTKLQNTRSLLLSKTPSDSVLTVFNYPHDNFVEYVVVKPDRIKRLDTDLNLIGTIPINNKNLSATVETAYGYRTPAKGIYLVYCKEGYILIDFLKNRANFVVNTSKHEQGGLLRYKYMACQRVDEDIILNVPGGMIRFNEDLELMDETDVHLRDGTYRYFIDKQDNLWTSEFASGIRVLSKNARESKTYLSERKVSKIVELGDDLYAGITDLGYCKLNTLTDSFELQKNLLTTGLMYKTRVLHDGSRILIAMDKTYRYKNDTLSRFKINLLEFNTVLSDFKDVCTNSEFGVAIHVNRILRYNLKTYEGETLSILPGSINLEYYQGHFYVAGTFGLTRLFTDTNKATETDITISEIPVNTTLVSGDYLFVGTDGQGLHIYNGNTIFNVKSTENLIIRKIQVVDHSIWLATDQGVKQVQINYDAPWLSPIIHSFYESDGLIQNNSNDLLLKGDTLYTACDLGISSINISPHLYEKEIPVHFNTPFDTLTLERDEAGFLSISFSAIDYINQSHFSLFYRLNPGNNEWTPTTTRTLNFSNLAPALYELEVKVVDQHFNENSAVLYINVLPQWWQTSWAKMLLIFGVMIFFGSIMIIIRSRIQHAEREKSESLKRFAQLELQALRSQMNPHFVHNSLNAIQYYIQRNEVEQSEDYLTKFSKLIRSFFEYSRQQHISLNEEIDLLNNYLEIEHLRFEDKLQFEINVDEELDPDDYIIPTMILQPIVENAVNHGIFHKLDSGKIKIDFFYQNHQCFRVSIEDNGVGIKKAKELSSKSRKNYTSRSSEVLKERLDLLEKSDNWNIHYKIEDLHETENQSGTRVSLTFNKI